MQRGGVSVGTHESKVLHVKIANDVSKFYNDLVSFAHIISLESVSFSWFSFPAIMSWVCNEILVDQSWPSRDWRARVIPCPLAQFDGKKTTIDVEILTVPLVPAADTCKSRKYRDSENRISLYFPTCQRKAES